jgi:hypothetical protein
MKSNTSSNTLLDASTPAYIVGGAGALYGGAKAGPLGAVAGGAIGRAIGCGSVWLPKKR